jgi:hypothetical protein
MSLSNALSVAPLPHVYRSRDSILVDTANEYQLVHEPRAGVVLFRYEGWTSIAHWDPAREMMEASIARAGSIAIITNGLECTGYEPEVREAWSAWCSAYRKHIRMQHFLARSSLLRMGVQTMSMSSRTAVKLYREPHELEAAVLADCPDVDLAPIQARRKSR